MAVLASAACGPAWAADAVDSVGQLRAIFQEISAGIDAFAAGNGDLVALGRRTAVALFGVLLVWGMIRSWILGRGFAQLLPEFIQPVVIFGLTFWAVEHLGPAVKSSVESLGAVFAQTLFVAGGPPSEVDLVDRMAAAGFAIVSASPQQAASDWIAALAAVAQQSVAFVFRLVAAVLLLVAGAVAAGVMVMAKVQTGLAILFAPVMIPWAMWQPSAFLFNAWLSFLIGGAMQSVMAMAVASLSLKVIDAMVTVSQSVTVGTGMSYVTCCVIVLMAVLVCFMFAKVPALSAALVGSAAIGMERWASASQSTGQGLQAIGRSGGAATGVPYQFGRGAVEGFSTASGPRSAGPTSAAGGASVGSGGRARGASGAAGRGAGWASAKAVSALGGSVAARGGEAGAVAAAAPGSSAYPTAPSSASSAGVHKPFRPRPGTRPVNRPLDRQP